MQADHNLNGLDKRNENFTLKKIKPLNLSSAHFSNYKDSYIFIEWWWMKTSFYNNFCFLINRWYYGKRRGPTPKNSSTVSRDRSRGQASNYRRYVHEGRQWSHRRLELESRWSHTGSRYVNKPHFDRNDVLIPMKCQKIGSVLNFVHLAGWAKFKTEPIIGHLKRNRNIIPLVKVSLVTTLPWIESKKN